MALRREEISPTNIPGTDAPGPQVGVPEVVVSQLPVKEIPEALSPAAVLPPHLHPARVYLASLSEGSRRTMRTALETIAKLVSADRANALTLPWQHLRYQHTAAIRSELAQRYAPATANKMLSALRGVLKECWRLGYTSAEDYERARDLAPVLGETLPRGRSLSGKELRMLFDACADDEKSGRGVRDAAMLATLYVCGLRRSELVALDLSDYEPASGEVRVRSGKGKKARIVYAVGGAEDALADWLSYRGEWEGPLFCPLLKSGRLIERRIVAQSVYDILKRREKELQKIAKTAKFSPHDLRRSFVSDLIDETQDLSAAQKLAGHASVDTTARYDRRGERAKKAAASHLHISYQRRR